MPFTPSPGNPKIASTPQSMRRVTNRSATVFDMTNSLKSNVMIAHDYCIVLLSAQRTFAMQELKQVHRKHAFCDPAFTETNGVPEFCYRIVSTITHTQCFGRVTTKLCAAAQPPD